MLSKIKLEEDYIMKINFKKIVIVLVIIAIIAGVITYFINKNKITDKKIKRSLMK